MFSVLGIFGKGKVVFFSSVRKLTPLQSSITTGEVHSLQEIGRKKDIGNCRQELADVRNASVLSKSLKSLMSCHETFLFFKWACQVCQAKLHINICMYVYISETSKHFLGMLLKNNPKDGQLLRNMWAKREQRKIKQCFIWSLFPFKSELLQKSDLVIWKGTPAHANLSFSAPKYFLQKTNTSRQLEICFKRWQQLYSKMI